MGRPVGPKRAPREGKCIICAAHVIEHNGRLRKTCSDACYTASRQSSRFLDEEVKRFYDSAGKDRREWLKTNYETPYYNVKRV